MTGTTMMKPVTTLLMLCVAGLLTLGMVMLYSASMVQHGAGYLVAQLLWCALGLIVCTVLTMFDYRFLKRFSWVLYGLTLILLALVLVPGIGTKVNGAYRWFNVAGHSFQPSEPAKLMMIILLAHYGEKHQRHMPALFRGICIPVLLLGAMLALIFVEPDRGTTILLAGVAAVMLLIAGARWLYLLPIGITGLIGLIVVLMLDPLRAARIKAWLYPEEYKMDVSYQAWQAMLAFGAGGPGGVGLGNSTQKLGFVPEHHTDFIFSIIGEELGIIATLGVVLGFVVFILCGVYIAWNARDRFGLLLGTGVTFLIGFQAFINIGVVTSALPNKGLPLPFISYGGSNLIMVMTCVGLLLSIARQATGSAARESGMYSRRKMPAVSLP